MQGIFSKSDNKLYWNYDGETLCVEPWGEHSLRIRAEQLGSFSYEPLFALTEPLHSDAQIFMDGGCAVVHNGNILCEVEASGRLTFKNQNGEILLKEFVRNRDNVLAADCSALKIDAREFKPILGGDYQLTARFESDPNERVYGMGQYQQSMLDLKGTKLELAQRNSQASVPFFVSSLGYGFLWNNPSIGDVTFAKNITEWHAVSSRGFDYWITAGDTPRDILEHYTAVTGRPPMMPEYGLGFWQCKLRYQTQEELLSVAREHKRRGLPMDVIVVDYFHWPLQGDWRFDPVYWPDPKGMVDELREMGIELMVSVWPTVDTRSENYQEMRQRGLLVKADRGVQIGMDFHGNTQFFDATNPDARLYIWQKIKRNYYDLGIRSFWLDEAEPEYRVYDFDNYRYFVGPNVRMGNLYPWMYARAFYDGMKASGQEQIVNLVRCAWAGSQKYGALVWSGDIGSSFDSMRRQLVAGLNMGMSGISWWTTDIGGFHGGNPDDPAFRELLARWFAWGAFCPVMRLHGNREPKQEQVGTTGGAECRSGADNEVWSFGNEVYDICKKYLALREQMRPYIREQMQRTHETGEPVMRPMFFDFPEDDVCWQAEDQYMFGPEYLVAPVMYAGMTERKVYLPKGTDWTSLEGGDLIEGGQWIVADAPLSVIPVYKRA